MSISRRTALKQLLVITGGVLVLPSCVQKDSTQTSIALKHLGISGKQEQLIAELAETIIPATNTPGAKDLSLHQFALRMVDDCSSPEDQKTFESGLKAFDEFTRKKFDKSFAELNATQRAELLRDMESKQNVPEDVGSFYGKIKGLTIQGYLSSKHYLTQVQVYELVPGRYRGCVPLSELQQQRTKAV